LQSHFNKVYKIGVSVKYDRVATIQTNIARMILTYLNQHSVAGGVV